MRRLLSVTIFTALLTLMRMLAGFIVAKVVAIYTGPAGMAMLGQIQNVISSLNGLVAAAVGNGVVRYTAENDSYGYTACSPWWKAAVRWAVLLIAIVFPLGIIFSGLIAEWVFHTREYQWLVIFSLCMMPLSVTGTFITSVINGQKKYKKYVVLGMCSVIFSSAIMLYFIINYKLQGALIAVVLQSGAIGIVYLISALREKWFTLFYLFGKIQRDNFISIGKYLLMAITTAIAMPLAIICIRNLLIDSLGWNIAGQWQAVWKISEAYLSVVTMAMSVYYLPLLSSIYSIDDLKREVNRTAILILPIVVILSLVVYFSRDLIITILFTEEFRAARDLFAIQLIGDVIKIASWIYAFPILSRGMAKYFISTEIIFSLTFVLLSKFLINIYGAHGVNIAYCINYSAYFFVVYTIMHKSIKYNKI
ncbi:O-antigen translocase [Lelliottia amnigena]|uniref:O-antigen translocase n=1 Tax=Lelliottia amnigena TaxID=61646 RepID=UPI001C21E4EF|nr:O-antigen translocase [Lelliottia amnigena]QXB22137.1 O-antigen translocase [Lelliottia amnigena]